LRQFDVKSLQSSRYEAWCCHYFSQVDLPLAAHPLQDGDELTKPSIQGVKPKHSFCPSELQPSEQR
jgi:hypothetical protein